MSALNAIDQARASEQRVHSAIANASARTGVDFEFLVREARIESGLNPQARARTSSATGLFQFTRQTWLATLKAHGSKHELGWAADAITQGSDGQYRIADPELRNRILDLRTQPEAASAMAAELASGHEDFLAGQLGRSPEPVDLYLAHFLGEAGAARFLEAHDANPDGDAVALLPAAAAANRAIFYRGDGTARSFAEIRSNFAAKLGSRPITPSGYPASSGFAFATQPAATITDPNPIRLRSIDPMPKRLSLDFARKAYQQLAALGSAS